MNSKTTKTEAISLRVIPVTNTSAIVVWLTRDAGRLVTIIKGAYRPKSMFFGRFDLFHTCELVYYTYAREHLHTARESSPLKWRTPFRSDWRACAVASYLCDLIEKVTPWGGPHPQLFALLDQMLDDLAEHGLDLPTLFWFELKLMELLGLAPRLNSCAACGKLVEPAQSRPVFSDAHGGILCRQCHRPDRANERVISPATIVILLNWQRSNDARMARRTRSSQRQSHEIAVLLGGFLRFHLESGLESRQVAFDIVS